MRAYECVSVSVSVSLFVLVDVCVCAYVRACKRVRARHIDAVTEKDTKKQTKKQKQRLRPPMSSSFLQAFSKLSPWCRIQFPRISSHFRITINSKNLSPESNPPRTPFPASHSSWIVCIHDSQGQLSIVHARHGQLAHTIIKDSIYTLLFTLSGPYKLIEKCASVKRWVPSFCWRHSV